MIHIRQVTREDFIKSIMRKMAPPLGSYFSISILPRSDALMPDLIRLCSDARFVSSRGAMGSATEYQSHPTKAT